jgi:CheY-like chemotaxis protein
MKHQVIIVEDCLIQTTVLKKILENEDFEVVDVYRSGSEAIEGCRQVKPSIVLMDVFLEGDMNGFEIAEKIRETNLIPFVFITAIKNSEEHFKIIILNIA